MAPSTSSPTRWTTCWRRSAVAAVVLLAFSAASAAAKIVPFKTPSGNIGCIYIKERGKSASIRCDMRKIDNQAPARPRSCELDYGQYFGMRARGKARRLCVGDTALDPTAAVLEYGQDFDRGGIRCTSTEARLRCENKAGHGFSLSRSSQQLF